MDRYGSEAEMEGLDLPVALQQQQQHDEDENSFTEDGTDDHDNGGKDKKNTGWLRMKWTADKVKLLILVLCSVQTDPDRKKSGIKKGKWDYISDMMTEKGFSVSPKQCQDKFSDLNKRYKKLNNVLGGGTAYKVVKNPALLDSMDDLNEATKEDLKKTLLSMNLFYEDLFKYHNRVHMEADLGMQSSTPRSRDDPAAWEALNFENDEENNNDENDRDAEAEGRGCFAAKRMKLMSEESEGTCSSTSHNLDECMRSPPPENPNLVISSMLPVNAITAQLQPSDNLDECMTSPAPENANPVMSGQGASYWTSDNLHNSTAPENQNPAMASMLPDNARTAVMAGMLPDSARTAWMAENGASYWTSDNLHDSTAPENQNPVMAGMLPDNARTAVMAGMLSDSARTICGLQMKDRKVDLRTEPFELLKERFKCLQSENERSKVENEHMALQVNQKDGELERLKLENENMKVQNARLSVELKHKDRQLLPMNDTIQLENERMAKELERLKLENENMKLENEGMAQQLKRKEFEIESNRLDAALTVTPHVPILQVKDIEKEAFEHEKKRFIWRKETFEREKETFELEKDVFTLENEDIEVKNERMALQLKEKHRELEALQLKQKDGELKRMKLENEIMALQLKQKELEIDSNRSEAGMTPHAPILERFQGRE